MRSIRRLAIAFAATALLGLVAVPSVSADSPRMGAFHATKECSAYTGAAGSYCTFTSSSLRALVVGSRIVYASAAGATGLDTDVRIEAGHNNTASGHCVLSFATGLGECTFWSGTGRFRGFHAHVAVSYLGGPNWAWDGTYWYGRHRDGDDRD